MCAALCCAVLPCAVLSEVLGSLSDWAVVSVGPPAADAELQLTAILNPLTREAQRISQVRVEAHSAAGRVVCVL